uniref:Putative defensin-like protein n=1 Tax=Sitobion avenae TaxID=44664 RepID=E2EZ04_9HEMI|nr:putative defensin-like protein precursor [Sitobion avenae]
MKLLVVFVSALVLVAASYEEEVADYAAVAGQEADGVEPQGVIDDEAEPMVGSPQEPVPESAFRVEIPITARACTNVACANICHRLGFRYGVCVSATLCQCSN